MQYQPPQSNGRPHAIGATGDATLHVCTMISNPVRYQSRYRLYKSFKAQNDGAHIEHWTVEVAYGNRPFVVTEAGNPRHLRLRTATELWHKENALNLLFAHVLRSEPGAEYFAWVDADVTFVRPDWAYETIQQLQHYDWVQMFSHAQDVDPKFAPIGKQFRGFVWAYCNDPQFQSKRPMKFGYTSQGHPGFAWAARRSALDQVGGLFDTSICGGADRHMACGILGTIDESMPQKGNSLDDLTSGFQRALHIWQRNAQSLKKNIGYVDGLINHHWHGRKADRQYTDRWKIYTNNRYDPAEDLKRDAQGLYQLTGRDTGLRDDLRSYFRARNEDSIDAE